MDSAVTRLFNSRLSERKTINMTFTLVLLKYVSTKGFTYNGNVGGIDGH